ncbi:T9SS type A sorting domain-containing protein [Hymenobacter lutimineralis]|nr:T9SS type A sorting domain-containing protein [Hymenobacter lutimineralis]
MKLFTRVCLVALLLGQQFVAAAASFTVIVKDFAYSPQFLTINPGDEVTFQWESGTHPTASDNGAFEQFAMNTNARTKTLSFPTAGVYGYHCTFHGGPGAGMFGSITVNTITPVARTQPAAASLQLYPNPSRGMVLLTLDQKQGQDYKLRITNIIGREVRVVPLRADLTAAGQPLNLSDLPAGMYMCSLLQNDKVVGSKRLILQN